MKYLVSLCVSALVISCSSESPKKIEKLIEKAEDASEVGSITKESFRPDLDILFVIDDSGSMSTHQNNLAINIGRFANEITQAKFLDYHIGVINSTMVPYSWASTGGGKLIGAPTFVTRATPNAVNVLAQNLRVGTNGSATEMFFDPLVAALTDPVLTGHNAGFMREDSYLAVIFLTDTDDQSKNTNPQAMYNFLIALKGSADRFFIGGAYIPDAEVNTCRGETSEINRLDNLPTFFSMTNATVFSLCDANFGEKLAGIGQIIAKRAQTMLLKKIPKKGTIKVMVGDMEVPNHPTQGWLYNPVLNAIEFGADIDWEAFPDATFPQVDFEAIDIEAPDYAPTIVGAE